MTREHHYARPDGSRGIIQDHGVDHDFGAPDGTGNRGAHFNGRPPDKPCTGAVPCTGPFPEHAITILSEGKQHELGRSRRSQRGAKAIYGDRTPSLAGLNLHEVVFEYDRTRVMLVFGFPEFPAVFPKKWRQPGCDIVQIRTSFVDIADLSLLEQRVDADVGPHPDDSGGGIDITARSILFGLDTKADCPLLNSMPACRSNSDRHWRNHSAMFDIESLEGDAW
ncbi:hypothetical protein FHX42_001692 [Saccharopolyspora lacisalsi]|uniref:HNH/Endo VII superfamily nuclease toxins domain-containing protein n=1 Tax=Halosaccharopolyspora lacisalsi TaxID=1000566 RepID=A0A839DYB4_9PSEU|nr:hypothetical protein [Halosaccharopolyspora lacisalsi]